MAMSSTVVSFRFRSLPATATTESPCQAATAASSVKSSRPASAALRCAARIGGNWNPCGVCARHRPLRATVSTTRPLSSTRFSVSATGRAATAPVCASSAARTRSTTPASTNGRAESWISTRSGASAARASKPLRTEICRVAPPRHGSSSLASVSGTVAAIPRQIVAVHHDQNVLNGGVPQENPQRVREHGRTACRPILLGYLGRCSVSVGPGSTPRGYDQGGSMHGRFSTEWVIAIPGFSSQKRHDRNALSISLLRNGQTLPNLLKERAVLDHAQ